MARPSNGPAPVGLELFSLSSRENRREYCVRTGEFNRSVRNGRETLREFKVKGKFLKYSREHPPGGDSGLRKTCSSNRAWLLSAKPCANAQWSASGRANSSRGLSVHSHDHNGQSRFFESVHKFAQPVFDSLLNFAVTEFASALLRCRRDSIKSDSHFTATRIIQPRDLFQRSRTRTATREAGEECSALIV